jgi:hypothetical protein
MIFWPMCVKREGGKSRLIVEKKHQFGQSDVDGVVELL